MKIGKKLLTILILFCVSITPLLLTEEVNAATKSYQFQVLDMVNEERAKVGAAPLKMDKDLYDAAHVRAKEQIIDYGHTRPDKTPWFTVSPKAHGENCHKGLELPREVMYGDGPSRIGWMQSAGHKKNILNPDFKSIGVGYFKGSSTCWVLVFGRSNANKIMEPVIISDPKLKSNNPSTPQFTLASANNQVIINWKKVSKASGYQIYTSTNKNGKYVLKKTITNGNTEKFTDTGLKRKTQYFYQIRSFIVNNGKTVFSNYSPIKSIKTK